MEFLKSPYRRSPKKSLLGLLLVSLILVFLNCFDFSKKIKSPLVDILAPFLSYVHHSARAIQENLWALSHFYALKKNNQVLSQEIQILKKQVLEDREIRFENKRLTELLGFKSQLNDTVLAARIIGKGTSNWAHSILIDKGTREGVQLNQAVICPQGVVGTIVGTSLQNATVLLLIDKNFQVGGLVQRTRDRGVFQGNRNDFCFFNYLSKNAQILAGDLVVCAGQNSHFPHGILLGEVHAVQWDRTGLYKIAEVTPAVDFYKLEEVLVVMAVAASKTS
jgi:rod shape-determining protein MreC